MALRNGQEDCLGSVGYTYLQRRNCGTLDRHAETRTRYGHARTRTHAPPLATSHGPLTAHARTCTHTPLLATSHGIFAAHARTHHC